MVEQSTDARPSRELVTPGRGITRRFRRRLRSSEAGPVTIHVYARGQSVRRG